MRILQLCHKPPYPAVDGGCIAMHQLTEVLIEGGNEVHILAMETFKHPFLEDKIEPSWLSKTHQETVFVNIKVNVIHAFLNLFSKKSYNIVRFFDIEFQYKLQSILKKYDFDLVVFESLYTAPYLNFVRKFEKVKTIYRAHNVEHIIWEHHANNQQNPVLKWYYRLLHRRLKKYELAVIQQFDSIATISEKEQAYFKNLLPQKIVETIPIYWQGSESKRILQNSEQLNFFHIGSMDWKPNQDGIRWFLNEVWRKIEKINPNYQLNLAGRSMPNWLLNYRESNVKILGKVENALDFIEDNDVMIVPLFTASGIRIKIIEAMSQSKVVLCTTVAAKGIKYEDGVNILIANTAEEFIQLITQINHGQIDLNKIGKAAYELTSKFHDKASTLTKVEHLLSSTRKLGHD